MVDGTSFAARLGEVSDLGSGAELLAERVRALLPDAALRVYVLRPADRCTTCSQAAACTTRDRCLHLVAELGRHGRTPDLAERIPRLDPAWSEAAAGHFVTGISPPPPELEAPAGEAEGVASLLPLVAGGRAIGVVGLRSEAPLEGACREALESAATLAGAVLRTLLSLEAEQRRRRHLQLIDEIGRHVTSILHDGRLLQQAVQRVQAAFDFAHVMILAPEDEPEPRLRLRAYAGRDEPAAADLVVAPEDGVVGRAWARGEAQTVQDVAADPDFVPCFAGTRSEMAVPILIGGEVAAILNVESDHADTFGEPEQIVLETIAHQLAIALENARLFGQVKAGEERYRRLVEANPGAVLHLDAAGGIVFANPAAEILTGRDRAALEGGDQRLDDLLAEEDRAPFRQALEAAVADGAPAAMDLHVIRPDGTSRTASSLLRPLGSEGDGEDAAGVVLLAQDRTRERELQDRLNQSERLTAIGSLVSGVAHELNNPLAGILGYAQLMLQRPLQEWTRPEIERIESNARRCQAIVHNLLTFGRQANLRRRRVDLNEVIDSVLRLNEYHYRMDDVEVVRDFDTRIPPLLIDVNRWQQVIINLVTNAHQALVGADASDRRIRVETRLGEDEIVVRVADNGPGIPTGVQRRIFEPFFTTKSGGTGLGLGICFGIVTEHGGTIELDTQHTEGASFVIRLPQAAVAATEGASPPPASTTASPTPDGEQKGGAGRRALVIDDEDEIREVVSRTLSYHGWRVDGAPSAAEALARIEQGEAYDAILADVSMPGAMDGIALYDQLRTERPDAADRLVFLTGNVLDEDLMARVADRAVRCVAKPFDIRDLADTVAEVANEADEAQNP